MVENNANHIQEPSETHHTQKSALPPWWMALFSRTVLQTRLPYRHIAYSIKACKYLLYVEQFYY